MISFHTQDIKSVPIKRRLISKWVNQIGRNKSKKIGEIAYIFCNDEHILEINREHLQHDYYTDVITFDYTEGNMLSGDIFISIDTVKSNAKDLGTSYTEELHRVIIHGVLHLCGIKDKQPEERAEMQKEEDAALYILNRMTSENNTKVL